MATITIDWDLGNQYENQEITLSDATNTIVFDDPQESVNRLVLRVVQGAGVGAKLATWPGNVYWSGGIAPTLSISAGDVDIIEFISFNTGSGFEYYGDLFASNII